MKVNSGRFRRLLALFFANLLILPHLLSTPAFAKKPTLSEDKKKIFAQNGLIFPTDDCDPNATPTSSSSSSGSLTATGDYSKILTAKNADKYFFNGSGDVPSAEWSDTDSSSMKRLLETYGDLAYQTGQAFGAPYIAILVQMRYEDPTSVCGANNFWGNGCDPSHATTGGATIQASNLGEGFVQYGKTLTNGYHDQAIGISDPTEYLTKLAPTWIGVSDSYTAGFENSVAKLTEYINSSEGQAIVKTFGNYYLDGTVNSGNSTGGSSLTSTGSASLNASGDAVNYRGDTILTKAQLDQIKQYQSTYEEAVKGTSLPWQVLATLHYRENSLSLENPSNGQGIFQFYSRVQKGETFPSSGTADTTEFLRQAKLATTDFLADLTAGGYQPSTEQGIMYGFFIYNGTASAYITQALALGFSQEEAKVGHGSPYVMNRYDEKRDPTVNPTKSNNTWGQIVTDGGSISYPATDQFGAFVVYAALAGGSWTTTGGLYSNPCVNQATANGNGGELIAAKARELAWPDKNHYSEIYPPFNAVLPSVGLSQYVDDLGWQQDCGHFVATVIRASGVDPDYPEGFTPTLEHHMSNSSHWQEIQNLGDESNLMPGDVFVVNEGSFGYGSTETPTGGAGAGGHTYIYLGGSDITASASLGGRTGNLGEPLDFSAVGEQYRIWRSTVSSGATGGTVGTFDEGLKKIEVEKGVKVGAAVSAMNNSGSSAVQIGGSWTGGRAWSTIKVPLAIAALQKSASTGSVTEPYGTSCSGPLSTAVATAITRSDNCGAWWLWVALGGDNSSAADTVTSVLRSGHDSATTVNGTGDGSSLTSGKTTWALTNQAIFASNLPSLSEASTVLNNMHRSNKSGDDSGWGILTIGSDSWAKGGWGSDATRQFGIVKWPSGTCSAIAVGTNASSSFSIINSIAQVLLDHQSELPSSTCPSGL